jgi:hypothetical protein
VRSRWKVEVRLKLKLKVEVGCEKRGEVTVWSMNGEVVDRRWKLIIEARTNRADSVSRCIKQ